METSFPIHPLIKGRWSARAISDAIVSKEELYSLFEAARLAPSSFNGQPWRFIYAKKGSDSFNKLFELMVPFNKSWTHHATYLVLILSRTLFEHNQKPSKTHSFDTGAAWENLALQGSHLNLVVHAIEGFDYQKAKEDFQIPDLYTIEVMVAVGKQANKDVLPPDLQKDEKKRERKPLSALVSENVFNFS